MRSVFIIMLVLFTGTGCITAHLSKGPDTSVLIQHEDLNPIGVAAALDDRDSEKIGTIGATTIEVKKSELTNLVSNHLIRYINEKIGLNVERVEVSDSDSIKLIASKKKVEGIIILRIKSLRMFSLDALLQPVEVDLTLELSVFEEGGQELYRRVITGHHEKRIGISIVEKATGEIVEAAIKDTLRQYAKDPDLKRIIARFKYGAVGGAMAQIF